MVFVVWLLALIGPRVALAFTWIFTSWVDRAFESSLWPILGFVVLPWTTLSYVVVWSATGLSTIGWLIVAGAAVIDLGSYGSARVAT